MLPQGAKNGPFQGQQGAGVTLSFSGPQGTILTSEIPQDFSGEEAQIPRSRSSLKIAQNGALQGLGGVKHLQTTKTLNKLLRGPKNRTFLYYILSQKTISR